MRLPVELGKCLQGRVLRGIDNGDRRRPIWTLIRAREGSRAIERGGCRRNRSWQGVELEIEMLFMARRRSAGDTLADSAGTIVICPQIRHGRRKLRNKHWGGRCWLPYWEILGDWRWIYLLGQENLQHARRHFGCNLVTKTMINNNLIICRVRAVEMVINAGIHVMRVREIGKGWISYWDLHDVDYFCLIYLQCKERTWQNRR